MKPFAESCEQNKDVILERIKPLLTSSTSLLEIGSGTGQHALHFAKAMPHLQWYTSERQAFLGGIQMWLDEASSSNKDTGNVHSPIALDVMQNNWPELQVDAIFTANTLHIMSLTEVQMLFKKAPLLLHENGILLVYGAFNYHGHYSSESNRHFDAWLKSRDPDSGIRDFEEIDKLAQKSSLQLQADYEMPANNRLLFWQKKS